MYTKAATDGFHGRFEFKDTDGNWQVCQGGLPENRSGRNYRYLTQAEIIEAERPKAYDKNYFLAKVKGSYPMWVRISGCQDMLLVVGVNTEGLTIAAVGHKRWDKLATQDWQWAQYHNVGGYEDLKWVNFVRE